MASRAVIPAILASAAFLLVAVADAQTPSRPGPEQKCNGNFSHYRTPSLEDLVDQAAIAAGLAEIGSRGRGLRSGFVAIEFRRTGEVRQIEYDADFERNERRALEDLLRRTLRPQPAQRENFSVWLWIDGGRAPSLRPLRMTAHCPAEVNNRAVFMSQFVPQLNSLGMQGFLENRSTYSTRIRFRVALNGQPEDVSLVQSSVNPQFDQALLKLIDILRFYPALHDGEPVEQWILVPARFFIR
jgi:TonB family protein